MPPITSLDDIYEVGALCQAQYQMNEGNAMAPYSLMIAPVEKARLVSAVLPDQVIEPLCTVIAEKISDPPMRTADLEQSDQVLYQYLQQQQARCLEIAPSQDFKLYMNVMFEKLPGSSVQSYLYKVLTLLTMPSYINAYKFLVDITKHQVQQIYELQDMHARIVQTNEAFTNFVKKLELWTKLEQNYDFKQDQQKTQKKLEEIYESLKQYFVKGDGGQQAIVEKLMKSIEGKAIPDKVMKVIEEEMQRFMEMDKMHPEFQNQHADGQR